MYIIGDIGNTEVKICLFTKNNKLIKKLILKTSSINNKYLKKKFYSFLKRKSINNIVFSIVVPSVHITIKLFLKKKLNIKSIEVKELNLKKLITIKANRKQVGSDRLCNAIAVNDNINRPLCDKVLLS